MVEQELPVVPDMSIADNAQILLDACQAVGLVEWSIALALALENTLILSGVSHGKPWLCIGFQRRVLDTNIWTGVRKSPAFFCVSDSVSFG